MSARQPIPWLLATTEPSHRGRVTGAVATLNAAATAGFAAIAGAAETFLVVTVLGAAAVLEALAGPAFLIMTRHLATRRTRCPAS